MPSSTRFALAQLTVEVRVFGATPQRRSSAQLKTLRGLVFLLVLAALSVGYGVVDFASSADPENLLIVVGSFALPVVILAYVVFRWQLRPPSRTISG